MKHIRPFIKMIILTIMLTALSITGCRGHVEIRDFYPTDKPESGKYQKGSSVRISDAYFVDWAYPKEKSLKRLFPNDRNILKFGYMAMQYHGCVFKYYKGDKEYKFLVMVARSATGTVSRIKNLYISKGPVTIRMTYLVHFPKSTWEFPEKTYPAMPVFLLKRVL